jgi:hypothetical protein
MGWRGRIALELVGFGTPVERLQQGVASTVWDIRRKQTSAPNSALFFVSTCPGEGCSFFV